MFKLGAEHPRVTRCISVLNQERKARESLIQRITNYLLARACREGSKRKLQNVPEAWGRLPKWKSHGCQVLDFIEDSVTTECFMAGMLTGRWWDRAVPSPLAGTGEDGSQVMTNEQERLLATMSAGRGWRRGNWDRPQTLAGRWTPQGYPACVQL